MHLIIFVKRGNISKILNIFIFAKNSPNFLQFNLGIFVNTRYRYMQLTSTFIVQVGYLLRNMNFLLILNNILQKFSRKKRKFSQAKSEHENLSEILVKKLTIALNQTNTGSRQVFYFKKYIYNMRIRQVPCGQLDVLGPDILHEDVSVPVHKASMH